METLITIFREVRDPRDINARHDLGAMLFIALAATLCGAKSSEDIADFGEVHAEFLGEIVDLRHGVPSHDTFSRVFRLLDPIELETALRRCTKALREALGSGATPRVVAIDGKSLRRAYDRGRAYMPALMVSVWDAETRLSIAARRAEDGNEVGATLELLKSLALKGCVVTADALHCHPKMASGVRAAGAHYALGLKANNGPLHRAAVAAFDRAGGRVRRHERTERGHDRHERRSVSVVAPLPEAPDFPHLAAFARVEAERQVAGGEVETTTRYVALSKKLSPSRALEVVRAHWGVENDLHWQLDIVFNEDDVRTRKDYAPQNLAVLRRICLDILRCHPAEKSIARKMKLAAWSRPFFLELFAHMR
jgi:predicted transposase YbfD/YdcC